MSLLTNVGAPDSNSFIEVTDADEYLLLLGDDLEGWDDLDDDQKEFRLELAANAMGSMLTFRGQKAYAYQALCFPRMQIYGDDSGLGLDGDDMTEIPENVKKSQALVAYLVVHKYLANRPSISETASETPDISSFSIRGISVAFRQDVSSSSRMMSIFESIVEDEYSMIYLLLSKYLTQIRAAVSNDRPAQLVYEE
jgi:hypothetical protein